MRSNILICGGDRDSSEYAVTTKTALYCALLRPLVSHHRYGAPLPKDEVIRRSPVASHNLGKAKRAFEDLRGFSFIVNHGKRGVELNNSKFDELADFLYDRCVNDSWTTWEIRSKLKHYEGWDYHEWADDRGGER